MSGKVELTGDTISRSGEQLTGTADRLAEEVASFTGRLAGFGDAFGGDDLGSTMQMIYDAVSGAAFECFDENTAVLSETGGQLSEMGAEYTEVERANQGVFTDLLGGMGG
ncbi:hypothetical protein AB0I60_03295 [Actinosynnema sp. NPDC050436]|uniref:hypothetical protein n=1 Tax=Actinosynnema sp. NPDC050436 TaxID=3155659 RepID=UPI0033DFA87A